jgi:hypothetical protein
LEREGRPPSLREKGSPLRVDESAQTYQKLRVVDRGTERIDEVEGPRDWVHADWD